MCQKTLRDRIDTLLKNAVAVTRYHLVSEGSVVNIPLKTIVLFFLDKISLGRIIHGTVNAVSGPGTMRLFSGACGVAMQRAGSL